jgi:hypothetical protein
MTVRDLISVLQKQDQEARVLARVVDNETRFWSYFSLRDLTMSFKGDIVVYLGEELPDHDLPCVFADNLERFPTERSLA